MVLNIKTVSSSNISEEYIERSRILRTISGSKAEKTILQERIFQEMSFNQINTYVL
jgi:hypothetical protein